MAAETNISWTDSTFNPWIGCSKISPGCDHCYAEVSTPSRTMKIVWGPKETRQRTSAANWKLPIRWNSGHPDFFAMHGRKRRVFCASLSDVFDNRVDTTWRDDLWALVRSTPNLDWLILTKRIGNVADMLPADWGCGYSNVWLGISVVNQDEADRDIAKLLGTPAATRWLSMEPLLGPVSLPETHGQFGETLDWIVVGGESGPHARPMKMSWVSALRSACETKNIPFFFKLYAYV
ncbi:MAG: phage Gp37/Gp68 family protein [bacterium]|nr:phage Gp37/Gp68 family protein [bacterium]